MKKFIMILCAMVAVVSVHAQDNSSTSDYSDKSGFRLQGGVGISTLYFKNQDDNYDNLKTKIKVGGFAGVGYEKRFSKVFALQPEVNYVNKGSKREFTDPPNGNQMAKVKLSLHTLEVPILAKFYLGDNFNIYVGPAFTFLLAAKNKSTFYNGAGDKIGDDQSVNIMKSKYQDSDGNSYFNRFDIGLNAGLEFVTNKGFFIGGRIDQGFMDLTNNDYKGYVGTDAIVFPGDNKWVGNTGVQVMAGFRF